MIFIDDIFYQEYFQIVQQAQTRANTRKEAQLLFPDTVIEKHHIIPESFYVNRKRRGPAGWLLGNPNDSENLVYLTAREHYRCHQLLTDMQLFELNYQEKAQYIMICALMLMSAVHYKRIKYSVREDEYEKAKKLAYIIRKGKPGTPCSELSKTKISNANKGNIPWNKNTTGLQISWNKGKHLSDDQKLKISLTKRAKNKHCSDDDKRLKSEANKGRIPWNKGTSLSDETRAKMSASRKGKTSSMRGKHHSAETRAKISAHFKGKPFSDEHRAKINASLKAKADQKRPTNLII